MPEQPDTAALQAELDGLLYAISHDLRAPMRAIAGFALALREQLQAELGRPLQGDGQRYLQLVENSTHRLQQMLEGLLALSRLSQQPMRLRMTPLLPLCQSVIAKMPPQQQSGIRLELAHELEAEMDPTLVTTALNALLDNACKFTAHLEQPDICIQGTRESNAVTLCVIDNGLGFDMQFASRLGIPFQHLHARPDLHGLGLGLATVRRIALRHGGELRADSQSGQGSRFFLRLPVSEHPNDLPAT